MLTREQQVADARAALARLRATEGPWDDFDVILAALDDLERRLGEVERERDAALAAIRDIDAHATPCGLLHKDDPEGSPAYYTVSTGSLHRALALTGAAAKCAILSCARADAALVELSQQKAANAFLVSGLDDLTAERDAALARERALREAITEVVAKHEGRAGCPECQRVLRAALTPASAPEPRGESNGESR